MSPFLTFHVMLFYQYFVLKIAGNMNVLLPCANQGDNVEREILIMGLRSKIGFTRFQGLGIHFGA